MKRTLIALLAVAACGDNLKGTGTGPGEQPDAGLSGVATAVVVAGDFNVTGILTTVRVPSGTITPNAIAGVAGGDPFIRRYGDEIFVINRASGDNITVLARGSLALVGQFGTGAGMNPQDVAPVGDTLYVAALAASGILVIDRNDPKAEPKTIDLSSLDVDGHPDCVSVIAAGDKLFAVCGTLDDHFAPRGNAKVAVIDPAQLKMTSSFELPSANPVGYLLQVPGLDGDLVMALAPDFQDFSTGCLARIKTTGTPAANGCAVTNAAIGGIANHFELAPDGKSLWIDSTAYDASFNLSGKVVALDLASLQLWPQAMTPPTMVATDLAACPNGYAVVVDSTFGKAGVRIFDALGHETTAGAEDIGRAPGFGNNVVCY
ncbi:MAG TPA: hypothetical protein VL463_07875 [Kofleriaceae bacterium]|nr:hypothetical protein [Kofleriaceae bacterium]